METKMKLLNKFDRLPFLLWVLVFLSISSIEAYSQFYVGRINTYAVTTFSETYSNVGGSSLGAGDDVVFTTTLPFNFNYDNTVFTSGTTVYIGSNGFVKFGGTNPGSGCCGNMLGSSTYGPGPVILGYDMVVQGGIYVETTGSSPNRVMSIESGFYIEETIPGNSISQVLELTQYTPNELAKALKAQIDEAIKSDRLKPNEGMRLLAEYEKGLSDQTYLTLGN
jgi:hypothetical protein